MFILSLVKSTLLLFQRQLGHIICFQPATETENIVLLNSSWEGLGAVDYGIKGNKQTNKNL